MTESHALLEAIELAPEGSTILFKEPGGEVEIIKPAGGENETMTENDSNADVTEKIEKTETGFSLKIKSTRGTGTRDQDTVEVEGKAETWDKLNSQRTAMRTAVTNEMEQRRLHKPDNEDDS